jgi:hypothetical protein
MATWKIYTTKDNHIAVATPYNAQIVAEAKRRMGKFIDLTVAAKDGSTSVVKAWKLDASHREAMESLCRELFPEADALIERVVTWTANEYSYAAPTIDGYRVVWFSRDRYTIARPKADEPIQILEIIEDNLRSGGSRNNPRLYGSLTLRLRCRPQAIAAGDEWIVEVVS